MPSKNFMAKYYNYKWRYMPGKELGRGQFGITYLCEDKETQEMSACKSISKRDLEAAYWEVATMQHLPEHPNIVALKQVYDDENRVYLLMELCKGGELFDRIVEGHYTEQDAAVWMRTIMEVVQTCHNWGVMHRDLKPENFLFGNENKDSPLKIIDFGLAVFFTPGYRFSELTGTPFYMAPEVWNRNYGPEVDIWSAGVILYLLLCRRHPFYADTLEGIKQKVLHGHLDLETYPWPMVSASAKSLVRNMLERNPKARYTAQQALNHPWIQMNAYKNTSI